MDRGQALSFRAERILQATCLPEPFIELPASDEDSHHPWDFGSEFSRVKLKVTTALGDWLAENPVHPSQRLTREQDQSICLIQVASREKFLDWLVGLRGFQLIEPADYAQALRSRAQVIKQTGGTFDLPWELPE